MKRIAGVNVLTLGPLFHSVFIVFHIATAWPHHHSEHLFWEKRVWKGLTFLSIHTMYIENVYNDILGWWNMSQDSKLTIST